MKNVAKVIDKIIFQANVLFDEMERNDIAPLAAGRAKWKRDGLIDALKIICEVYGLDFRKLWENEDEEA